MYRLHLLLARARLTVEARPVVAAFAALAFLSSVGAVYVAMPVHTCYEGQTEGCGGAFPCYVDDAGEEGETFWPPVGPFNTPICMAECPNAHCYHTAEAPTDLELEEKLQLDHLASVKDRVAAAIETRDAAMLGAIADEEAEVTLNAERGAIQIVTGCSRNVVVAHFPVSRDYFDEARAEYRVRSNIAYAAVASARSLWERITA